MPYCVCRGICKYCGHYRDLSQHSQTCCSMDGYMSLSGLRPWPEERLAEFGRRQYYGVEAGTHDAQGRIDRCAHPQAYFKTFCPEMYPPYLR